VDPLNLVLWGIIGAMIGLVISIANGNRKNTDFFMDIFAGLVGGVIGGTALRLFNVTAAEDLTGVIHMPSVVIAMIGALFLAGVTDTLSHQNQ
jgi:uncharacterized membrane protein YeaQ/YmgE (transglycosylase-associated protein family)